MGRSAPPVYRDCPGTAERAWRAGHPLRPTRWSAWDALWAVLGSFVLGTVVAVAAAAVIGGLDGIVFVAAVAVPWISMAGWPLFVTARRGNGFRIDLGWSFRRADWRAGLIGGAAAFAVAMVVGVISTLLFGEFTSTAGEEAERLAQGSPWWVLALFALLVAAGAPIAEELTFRGLLWSGLAKRGVRPWLTVAVSATAFAALHFEPQRLPLLLAVGIVLGVVRWRTRSLGACIVAHGVNNAPGAVGILVLGL